MIDLIKKAVLTGVGAAVVTKEKVEAGLQELVKQGKLSASDASATASRIASEGRKEFENVSREINDRVKEVVNRSTSSQEARLSALEARVKFLEEKHGLQSETPPVI